MSGSPIPDASLEHTLAARQNNTSIPPEAVLSSPPASLTSVPASTTATESWTTPLTTPPFTSTPSSVSTASLSSTSASTSASSPVSDTSSTSTPTATPSAAAHSASHSSSHKWLPAAIACSVAFVALVGLLALWWFIRRRRRRQFQIAQQYEPQLTPSQFRRRRNMSPSDLAADAEAQRRAIIRKSIMSRSSGSLSQLDLASVGLVGAGQRDHTLEEGVPEMQQQEHQDPTPADYYGAPEGQAGAHEGASLREDFKAWQADIQRHGSRMDERHPSTGAVGVDGDTGGAGEHEALDRQPSFRSISPPIPERSRLRPLSTDLSTNLHNLPAIATQAAQAEPVSPPIPRHTSAASRISRMTTDTVSPTSLYSVDLQGGRQNGAWSAYHHD